MLITIGDGVYSLGRGDGLGGGVPVQGRVVSRKSVLVVVVRDKQSTSPS